MRGGLRRPAQGGARFVFKGFHLHLSDHGSESRVAAIEEIAARVEAAKGLGLPAQPIDVARLRPVVRQVRGNEPALHVPRSWSIAGSRHETAGHRC
ncbi:hypothetical protein MRF4_29110 [Methylobacterium radiotolerans]